ncbi:MAG: SDR family oxidoreductase [Flavobacteriales bacterium]|nr:SDR family oxidoreductase [Flavobacteriales bacterium]
MKRDFREKVIVVTGGSGGLGLALVKKFASEGAKVAAIDINEPKLAELEKLAKENAWKVKCYVLNITDEQQCHAIFNQIRKDLGAIYCLINNAGITHIGKFNKDHAVPVRNVMEVNLFGAVNCTAQSIEDIAKNSGIIIPISSAAGLVPLINRTAYAASKHAMVGLFNSLRIEYLNEGVQVLMVCPSAIATDIRKTASEEGEKHAGMQAMSPEEVATKIFEAAARNERFLMIGKTGKLGKFVHRFFPKTFDKKMLERFEN